ncbi:MAG: hypothetical protein EPN76_03085 [Burkholderiaceae bacterium]|nr:MAG: hypothetical protein EPN76_03085 [Burkholderiaceae bacterium]TAM02517.1 MAG: hypothetical protein EPN67_11030 [Pusillimonas sp.]
MNNFRQVEENVFIGPQPTQHDLQDAKQQGVKTVIDFRMPAETTASNEALTKNAGLDYANIPVNKGHLDTDQIGQLDVVMRSKSGPFLLHCATGARAALLYSLGQASQQNWTVEQTFDAAKKMGFDLKATPEFSTFVKETIDRPKF